MSDLSIGILQPDSVPGDRNAQLETLRRALGSDATRDLDLLVCPELFATGYNIGDRAQALAEPADGFYFQEIAALASQAGTAVLYGYPERHDGRVYNSAACISAEGALLANHRKLHLSGPYERAQFVTGDDLTLFTVKGVRIAILICYDVEFPEAVRGCALSGAELVCVPTALGAEWLHVSQRTVPTRAMENGVYIAYANWPGTENGLAYAGSSCVVGPDGFDIARAGDTAGLIAADITRTAIDTARSRLPYLKDRRAELQT